LIESSTDQDSVVYYHFSPIILALKKFLVWLRRPERENQVLFGITRKIVEDGLCTTWFDWKPSKTTIVADTIAREESIEAQWFQVTAMMFKDMSI
jgi:hypothetical protein